VLQECHTIILKNDDVLRALFRWDKFPDATTFGRIFRLFSARHCKELADVENAARRKVWTKKWFGKITLDMDSTVRGVYGSQEGAEKAIIHSCVLLPKTENVSTTGSVRVAPIPLTAAWNS
jgi:hypothetical protein